MTHNCRLDFLKTLLMLASAAPLVAAFPGSNSWTIVAFIGVGMVVLFVRLRNQRRPVRFDVYEQQTQFDIYGSAIVAAVVFILLIGLEFSRPHYFIQDDNFVQFSPILVKGAKHFVSTGQLLTYDFSQFFGRPVFGVGVYSVAYPVTWLAYLVASVFGDVRLTIDVFCIIHLVAGGFATCLLLRHLNVSRDLAVLTSVAISLSGWNLIIGRSWYYVVPYAFFIPIAFLGLLLIHSGLKQKTGIALLTLSVGMSIYAGNAQYWVYFNLFIILFSAITFFLGGRKPEKVLLVLCAMLVGYSLASPQLVPQLSLMQEVLRGKRDLTDDGTISYILSFFFPWPLTENQYCAAPFHADSAYGDCSELSGRIANMYTVGPVFAVAVLFYGFYFAKKGRWEELGQIDVLFILGLISAWASLGKFSALWMLMHYLPIFDKFSWSFKFIPFTNFFLCVAAACLIDKVVHEKVSRIIVVAIGYVFILSVIASSSTALHLYKPDDISGNGDAKGLIGFLKSIPEGGGRVHPLPAWFHEQVLLDNYIETSGGISTRGYDPIIEDSRQNKLVRLDTEDSLREYGVRYVISSGDKSLCEGCRDLGGGYSVREVSNPKPYAFIKSHGEIIDVNFNIDKRSFSVPANKCKAGDQIVVNVLDRSGLRLLGPGGEVIKHSTDDLGRVLVTNCGGISEVTIGYKIRYLPVLFVALGFLLLSLLALAQLARRHGSFDGIFRPDVGGRHQSV